MKVIGLTCGQFAIIDDIDFELVSRFKWCAAKSGNTFYAYRRMKIGHRTYKSVFIHQLILPLERPFEVDHINRNGLDNRRKNLRKATKSKNLSNQLPRNSTRFKGVCQVPGYRNYKASIRSNGQGFHLGTFDTAIEAAVAYNNAAIRLHGSNAFLNQISQQ